MTDEDGAVVGEELGVLREGAGRGCKDCGHWRENNDTEAKETC